MGRACRAGSSAGRDANRLGALLSKTKTKINNENDYQTRAAGCSPFALWSITGTKRAGSLRLRPRGLRQVRRSAALDYDRRDV